MPLEDIPVLENAQATQTIIQQIAGDVSNKQDHSANLDAWSLLATSSKQDASETKDVSSVYAIEDTDYAINCIGTANFLVALPSSGGVNTGKVFVVKNSGSGLITLIPTAGETIDNETSQPIHPLNCIVVISIGTSWIII